MKKRSLFRIIVLGDAEVGKTSLTRQYVEQKFTLQYRATIGADFFAKQINIRDHIITLQVWDTAGQERFGSLGAAFYRGADACALVYDITNPRSFESLDMWKENFLENGSFKDPESFPFILLGNKADREAERQVSTAAAQAWCEKNGDKIQLFEVSATKNLMVEEAFQSLTELMIEVNDRCEKIILPESPRLRSIPNNEPRCAC